MCLDNIDQRIENNKQNLGKTVWQLQSQIGRAMANSVHTMTLKKSSKTKTIKRLKKYCVTKMKLIL